MASGTAHSRKPDDPSLRAMVLEDVRRGAFAQGFRRDLRDIYRFYLADDERERLAAMRPIKRFFWIAGWLARNLLRRLSPNRRLLLVLAAVLFLSRTDFAWGTDIQFHLDLTRLAVLPVLLVLMLELKDKLLARDEIEVARQVQLSLLPRSHPAVPGWDVWSATTPANDVGGDLVDYIEGGSGRLGLALGDVAGKGMGAALLCAKLQATLRALAPVAPDLRDLGGRLNGVLERTGLDNRYATLFYCEIAPGDPEVRFLNAGHNPALLVRRDGITPLGASSLPLGMLPSSVYAEGTVTLDPGDALVVYSDGITEAVNAAGEEFGPARVSRAVVARPQDGAEPLARRILDDVSGFLGGERPQDDQSVLVLRRTA